MASSYSTFPDYTEAERWADAVVHMVGLIAAPLAVAWLFTQAGAAITPGRIVTAAVYAAGLIGMLTASALYNMVPAGPLKSILRRLDHAMIFVMIAGTYTPLSLTALSPEIGIPLCAVVWGLAAIGIALKIFRKDPHERLSMILYLSMGWLLVPVLPPLITALPAGVMILIVAGGLVYSAGSYVHTRINWPFHNAISRLHDLPSGLGPLEQRCAYRLLCLVDHHLGKAGHRGSCGVTDRARKQFVLICSLWAE
jgi:hemolysin III